MLIIDSTDSLRLVLDEDENVFQIQRYHPRTGWFVAYPVDNERAGRASLGSFAELIGEMDQLSAETMELR